MIYAIVGLAIGVYTVHIKGLVQAIKSKYNAQRKAEIVYLIFTTILFAGISYFGLNMN